MDTIELHYDILMCLLSHQHVFVPKRRLRPALLLLPGAIGLVGVDLSACLCRVAEVELFHLFRLDDDDSEVLSRNRVIQIFDFCAESQVLLIVRL
jgi:hypothetical protein